MNIKPKMQPGARPLPSVEDDERHRGQVDDFISRNREALNSSLRRSRKQVAEGDVSSKTIDDIISEGRKKNGADS